MDEIRQLEQEIEQLKAQVNFEIGKRTGKIDLLKQQNEKKKEKSATGDDKNSGQTSKPDSPK